MRPLRGARNEAGSLQLQVHRASDRRGQSCRTATNVSNGMSGQRRLNGSPVAVRHGGALPFFAL